MQSKKAGRTAPDFEKTQIALVLKTLKKFSPVESFEITDKKQTSNVLQILETDLSSKKTGAQIMHEFSIPPTRLFSVVSFLADLPIIVPKISQKNTSSVAFFTTNNKLRDQGFIMEVTKNNFMLRWFLVLRNYLFVLNAIVLQKKNGHLLILQVRLRDLAMRSLEKVGERDILESVGLVDVKTGKEYNNSINFNDKNVYKPIFLLYDKLFIVTELLEKPNVAVGLFRKTPNMMNRQNAIVTDSQFGRNAIAILKSRLPTLSDSVLAKSSAILREFIVKANHTLDRHYGQLVKKMSLDSNFAVEKIDTSKIHSMSNAEINKLVASGYFSNIKTKSETQFVTYYKHLFPTLSDDFIRQVEKVTRLGDESLWNCLKLQCIANGISVSKTVVLFEIARDNQVKLMLEDIKSISYPTGEDNRSLLRKFFEAMLPSSIWARIGLGVIVVAGSALLLYQYWDQLKSLTTTTLAEFSRIFTNFWDLLLKFLPSSYGDKDCPDDSIFGQDPVPQTVEIKPEANTTPDASWFDNLNPLNYIPFSSKDAKYAATGAGVGAAAGILATGAAGVIATGIGMPVVGASALGYGAYIAIGSGLAGLYGGYTGGAILDNAAQKSTKAVLILEFYNRVAMLTGMQQSPDLLMLVLMSCINFMKFTKTFLTTIYTGDFNTIFTGFTSIAAGLGVIYGLNAVFDIKDLARDVACTMRYFSKGSITEIFAKLQAYRATTYVIQNPYAVFDKAAALAKYAGPGLNAIFV